MDLCEVLCSMDLCEVLRYMIGYHTIYVDEGASRVYAESLNLKSGLQLLFSSDAPHLFLSTGDSRAAEARSKINILQ